MHMFKPVAVALLAGPVMGAITFPDGDRTQRLEPDAICRAGGYAAAKQKDAGPLSVIAMVDASALYGERATALFCRPKARVHVARAAR